jgi:hypothetical protein
MPNDAPSAAATTAAPEEPVTEPSGTVVQHPAAAAAAQAPTFAAPANQAGNAPAGAAAQPAARGTQENMCALKVDDPDERGNTVKYIYACDPEYVVYYSRLEHRPIVTGGATPAAATRGGHWLPRLRRASRQSGAPSAFESEGVQAQLSSVQETRQKQRKRLLPLGVERAKLQALLAGWPWRRSYDSSIATALQLALDDDGSSASAALETLSNARAAILRERDIAGRTQYVKFTLIAGLVGLVLLVFAQHNLFRGSGFFWLGTQVGLIGAILSIAIGIRKRTVALDIGFGANLSDSVLRLIIGAVSGGTLVLLFTTGMLPALTTNQGQMDGRSMTFAMLLGIMAGFVEQLVPSLLEAKSQGLGGGDGAKSPSADGANKADGAAAKG